MKELQGQRKSEKYPRKCREGMKNYVWKRMTEDVDGRIRKEKTEVDGRVKAHLH